MDPPLCVKEHGGCGIRPRRQAFQHCGVEDMRLSFVGVHPSDCAKHDGVPRLALMDGWMAATTKLLSLDFEPQKLKIYQTFLKVI